MADLERRTAAELDRQYLWHPFTPIALWEREEPLVIERGEGSYLIDTRGRRYLDGVSSLWVTVHGHAHPKLTAAITEQARLICHSTALGLASVPAARLAERLVRLAPPRPGAGLFLRQWLYRGGDRPQARLPVPTARPLSQ